MRPVLFLALAGLLPGLWLGTAGAAEPAKAAKKPAEVCTTDSCGDFGTSVNFVKTPSDAATQATKEEKLVFVLHVSGLFEDPGLTWNNAEALRVNALANPRLGKFINENFVSSFQKVATFRIVNGNKQGGNVASYFCAPDGRVLHCVAGPVDADTLLREAKWVVERTLQAMKEPKADGTSFKAHFRKAHAERLRTEHGLIVEPVTFDPPVAQDASSPLTYRDPTGRSLAPKLPPPPVNGPDVKIQALLRLEKNAETTAVRDLDGRAWNLSTQGQVHQLLAGHALVKIETLYGAIFEGILGEQISTRPVEIVDPFPWQKRNSGRVVPLPGSGGKLGIIRDQLRPVLPAIPGAQKIQPQQLQLYGTPN